MTIDITPARKLTGTVERVLKTFEEGFETKDVEALDLTFEGIPGDRHAGVTRKSGGREPWYKRGTEIRNERQVTLLCPDELAATADAMEIDRIDPGWIGGNILLSGVPHLSYLPARSLIFFENGVTLVSYGMNGPCKFSGAAIGKRYPDKSGLDLLFPKAAKRTRGILAWVEKPGTVQIGETVKIRMEEQWVHPGA
ncbi:MAG: molybdenum cofactor sulfurase [Pseudomonadota bacterium]